MLLRKINLQLSPNSFLKVSVETLESVLTRVVL